MSEDLELRLRRALAAEADTVQPTDGLHRIRAAIAAGERLGDEDRGLRRLGLRLPRSWSPLAAAAAILALAVLTPVLFRLAAPGPEGVTAVASGGPDLASPLPVYYVGEQDDRQALVREFHPTTLTSPPDRLQSAVRLAVAGDAADPDYTTAWPTGTSVETVLDTDAISVQVSGGGLLASTLTVTPQTEERARLAVDQVVWTATATAQQLLPVRITIGDGGSTSDQRLFGALDLNRPFERSLGPDDPRAPVWVSSLVDGERLAVGTATVTGDSAVSAGPPAPASGRWTLERLGQDGWASETVGSGTLLPVLDAAADTSTASRRAWQITVALSEPGRYLLRVEQDGWVATTQITVQ